MKIEKTRLADQIHMTGNPCVNSLGVISELIEEIEIG